MSEQVVTNPGGVYRTVTDFTTFKDASGEAVGAPPSLTDFYVRANAPVLKGEVVMWVVPTATLPLSVTPMTAAAADNLYAGVALQAAATGAFFRITDHGFAFVDVAAETPAFGNPVTAPATTTGKAEIGATFDATLVVASYIGTALGAKDAANLCPVYLKQM